MFKLTLTWHMNFFQWLPLIFNDFSRQNAIFPGQHKIQWLFKSRVKFHDFSRPVWTMIADSGRSPRSPSNASLYWERTGSVEVRVLDTVHTRSILLSSIVIRSIFCAVDSPVPERGRWSSFTTTNSTLYFFDVLGFLSTRRHLPKGLHQCSVPHD